MFKRALAAFFASLSFMLPAHATSVLPLGFDEIVDTAAVAFEGTVLANRSARDDTTGFIVTYTTFSVRDLLKGDAGTTHTIKQIGGELASEGIKHRVHSIPRFAVGESYVVFLYGVSQAGFSSPVGLSQGAFSIVSDEEGVRVTNGNDFRDMAPNARLSADKPTRRLALASFKQMVRDRAAAHATGSGK